MAIYRKTKVIQSYLRMWESYDPIESEPSDPKKLGLYGCSIKKGDFGGKKGPKRASTGSIEVKSAKQKEGCCSNITYKTKEKQ